MTDQDRADLIEVIHLVLGERQKATAETMFRVYRGDRAMVIEFTLEGQRSLGRFVISIPEEVQRVIDDQNENPYNNVGARAYFMDLKTELTMQRDDDAPKPD